MASTSTKKPRTKKAYKANPTKTWTSKAPKSPTNGNGNNHNYTPTGWKPYGNPTTWMSPATNMPPYLADTVNRMIEELTSRWDNADGRPWTPRCDWWETSTHYTICCYVPGCSKTDCKIECTENSCTVSGACPPSKMPKNATCYTCECQWGNWRRTFNFPYPIHKNSCKATCKNGVLTVTCKKQATTKYAVKVA